jgi:hypothetical protein
MSQASTTLAAFHLIGEKSRAEPEASDRKSWQPALFGAYREVSKLRYDFPLVLVEGDSGAEPVESLADIMDAVLQEVAPRGDSGEQTRLQVLGLEQEIRTLVAGGREGTLSALWDAALRKRVASTPKAVRKELTANLLRARAALQYDGEVAGYDSHLPARLLTHLWKAGRQADDERLHDRLRLLSRKLHDILQVDYLHSDGARDARQLESSMGSADAELFDFREMSEILKTAPVGEPIPESRRRRIQEALSVLDSQRFVGHRRRAGGKRGAGAPFSFEFDSCGKALAAFRKRLPDMATLIRAISIAELEIANQYDESQHDSFFSDFDESSLGPGDLALFPSYLVFLPDGANSAAGQGALLELIRSGLPAKVLALSHDILEDLPLEAGELSFGVRGQQLASMALGLNSVFVLQASGSSLYRLRESVLRGLSGDRPALFSVYSGANSDGVEPYLRAAAATDARAFPCFVFDPDAGGDWASRFSLDSNPQADRDWPSQTLKYEDSGHNRLSDDISFTLVDFAASDSRHAFHSECIPRDEWSEELVPVSDFLDMDPHAAENRVPYVLLIDDSNTLQRAVVDEKLIDGARRCRDSWRSLQELGGIHNSHAASLLADARESWEEEKERLLAERAARGTQEPAGAASPAPQAADTPEQTTEAPAVEAQPEAPAIDPDEPWIETPRCTTCNECTDLNSRMFAYNDDMQAYIADPDAGTYRQLIEAAESCQVCIIHPGKPRNPDEPGLEELIERAEPFM